MDQVPYTVYESSMARADRKFRLMWVLIVIMFISLVGTNAGWIIYESSFEDMTVTQENADGINNYIGNDGSIVNGETDD